MKIGYESLQSSLRSSQIRSDISNNRALDFYLFFNPVPPGETILASMYNVHIFPDSLYEKVVKEANHAINIVFVMASVPPLNHVVCKILI